MCGRFTLIRLSDFTNLFPWIVPPAESPGARYNIAPTQAVAAAVNEAPPRVEFLHFGLIPSWAKEAGIGNRMINARAETLDRKPAFRGPLRRRRCVIPASGFYEWRKEPAGGRTPFYITLKDGRPMAFAGLWDRWQAPDGSVLGSCAIITTAANGLVRPIHDRMPAILDEEACRRWLAPGEADAGEMMGLLDPYPADAMRAVAVSRTVNNPKHDTAACIEPAEPEPPRASARRPARRRKGPDQPMLFPPDAPAED